MTRHTTFITLLSLSILGACTSDDGAPPTGQVAGELRYRDAATNPDGTPREAATPPAQDGRLTVEVRGTGTLDGLTGACALEAASGQFRARFDAAAAIGPDGAYVATLASAAARLETLGGCPIPDLTVALVTDVVVRAELDATTATCESYCAASARSDAEATCAGSATQATCRAAAEADAQAACHTECTTQRDVIVAEASLSASLLGEVDAELLRAAALGELRAELTLDRME
ncbi:MAG: hypothetical protein HS111_17105 [Kofleriaceae bacterium]|nr:hypothetical protein [Kofleriaceae bacterium]MCL4223112.1 hypothetical protein [Myxococcales bacterium]